MAAKPLTKLMKINYAHKRALFALNGAIPMSNAILCHVSEPSKSILLSSLKNIQEVTLAIINRKFARLKEEEVNRRGFPALTKTGHKRLRKQAKAKGVTE